MMIGGRNSIRPIQTSTLVRVMAPFYSRHLPAPASIAPNSSESDSRRCFRFSERFETQALNDLAGAVGWSMAQLSRNDCEVTRRQIGQFGEFSGRRHCKEPLERP